MKFEKVYVVKAGRHYNSYVTAVHIAKTKEDAEQWISEHIRPGEHMYIATGKSYEANEICKNDMEG